jgi:hypothetical protein
MRTATHHQPDYQRFMHTLAHGTLVVGLHTIVGVRVTSAQATPEHMLRHVPPLDSTLHIDAWRADSQGADARAA